jgi:hypothetical protein
VHVDAEDQFIFTATGAFECFVTRVANQCNGYINMFEVSAALAVLFFAYAAFCPPAALNNWSCQWCSHTTPTVSHVTPFGVYGDGTFGYVALNDTDTIIVSFRGTNNIENWIDNDLDFPLVPFYGDGSFDGVKVHAGFLKGYHFMQSQIADAVEHLFWTGKVKRIVCTGHSLGAALASVAAFDLAVNYSRNLDVFLYTYGSPRIGNQLYVTVMETLVAGVFRVTHLNDIVPHLPLQSMGFTHVPQEFWFNNKTNALKYRMCSPDNGEDPTCADSVPAVEWHPSDHMTYLGVFNAPCNN